MKATRQSGTCNHPSSCHGLRWWSVRITFLPLSTETQLQFPSAKPEPWLIGPEIAGDWFCQNQLQTHTGKDCRINCSHHADCHSRWKIAVVVNNLSVRVESLCWFECHVYDSSAVTETVEVGPQKLLHPSGWPAFASTGSIGFTACAGPG